MSSFAWRKSQRRISPRRYIIFRYYIYNNTRLLSCESSRRLGRDIDSDVNPRNARVYVVGIGALGRPFVDEPSQGLFGMLGLAYRVLRAYSVKFVASRESPSISAGAADGPSRARATFPLFFILPIQFHVSVGATANGGVALVLTVHSSRKGRARHRQVFPSLARSLQ